jgi:citrate lyase gamma subunit
MLHARKRLCLVLALGLIGSAVQAQDCDTIRAQIESRIRANGVAQFSLEVVDQTAPVAARSSAAAARAAGKSSTPRRPVS